MVNKKRSVSCDQPHDDKRLAQSHNPPLQCWDDGRVLPSCLVQSTLIKYHRKRYRCLVLISRFEKAPEGISDDSFEPIPLCPTSWKSTLDNMTVERA